MLCCVKVARQRRVYVFMIPFISALKNANCSVMTDITSSIVHRWKWGIKEEDVGDRGTFQDDRYIHSCVCNDEIINLGHCQNLSCCLI